MIFEVPDIDLGPLYLTPERGRVELAVGLYAGRHVSLGRAARIAGIPYADFLKEIGTRGISIHYTTEDAEHDMKMADELSRIAAKG
jgi:predicted HTH domain antitoxin